MIRGVLITLIIILGGLGALVFLSRHGFTVERAAPITKNALSEKPTTLPKEKEAPEFAGIAGWINSGPLSLAGLTGRVVLIDFWTYSCINCIRTLPYLSQWYSKYKDNGFMVVGVHSPEFDFEKKKENVLAAAGKYHISYPVALDSDHKTWDAYNNQYWPAHYLIDAKGLIRYHNFGEGHYAETERAIQELLIEAGHLTIDKIVIPEEAPSTTNFSKIGTPEIYLGYFRINNLGNEDADIYPDAQHNFSLPPAPKENRFYLGGIWKIAREYAELVGSKGGINLRYKASSANIVADSDKELILEVKLDGASLTDKNRGKDIFIQGGKSFVSIRESRLYNLVYLGGAYDWHILEIIIPSSGLRAFTFTFG